MAASTLSVDLKKQFEGLTAEDLEDATELSNQLPKLKEWEMLAEPTPMKVEQAKDAMKDAIRIRQKIWAMDSDDIRKAYDLHRSLTAKRTRRVAFFEQIEAIAKRIIGNYDSAQQRKADAIRRELEHIAREEAERQRKAEADALIAEAAAIANDQPEAANELLEAAQAVEEAPVVPVAVPEIAPPKVEGTSVSYKLVGEVKDARALLMFLIEGKRDDLINSIVEWKQRGIDTALKNGLELPGVDVKREPIVRNLSR
jgi:hypothetical protein